MSIVFIVIGIFLVLMFIVRPVSNKVVSTVSKNEWDRILVDINLDSDFREIGIHNISYIINTVLKPLNVDYYKFCANLFFLYNDGRPRSEFPLVTPSIRRFGRSVHRPHLPLWYIAAFPDILSWINSLDIDSEYLANKIYVDISEKELEASFEGNGESVIAINTLKKMVYNYKRNVKPYLETVVDGDVKLPITTPDEKDKKPTVYRPIKIDWDIDPDYFLFLCPHCHAEFSIKNKESLLNDLRCPFCKKSVSVHNVIRQGTT
jgi:hypothetical protein